MSDWVEDDLNYQPTCWDADQRGQGQSVYTVKQRLPEVGTGGALFDIYDTIYLHVNCYQEI